MAAILLAAVFQAVSAYRGALKQADAIFDYHLQQMALVLRGGPPLAVPLLEADAHQGLNTTIQIWGPDGTRLFQSRRFGLPACAVLGFSDLTHDGVRYRIYSLQTAEQTIRIAQDLDDRQAPARALAAHAMVPMAVIAPLLMLVLWLVIRHSLGPLERTRQQVAARALDDLSPLPETGLPDEVRPQVQELNLLFGRLGVAVDAQKSFVAHAAHALRSPLTALKLQAQALERQQDPEARRQGILRLHHGIDRAIRLKQQLLLLARQEATPLDGDHLRPVDLPALAQQVIGEWLPQARAKGIDLGLGPSEPAQAEGDADTLSTLLRKLLENAVKYTPRGGCIDVRIHTRQGQIQLNVEDCGPGIPPEERPQAFERLCAGPRRAPPTAAMAAGSAWPSCRRSPSGTRRRCSWRSQRGSAGCRSALCLAPPRRPLDARRPSEQHLPRAAFLAAGAVLGCRAGGHPDLPHAPAQGLPGSSARLRSFPTVAVSTRPGAAATHRRVGPHQRLAAGRSDISVRTPGSAVPAAADVGGYRDQLGVAGPAGTPAPG